MKKILFTLSLVCLFFSVTRANTITVQNLLSNPVTVYFYGVNLSGTTFTSSYITFPPGPTTFTDPTFMPGTAPFAEPTGRVIAVFGVCNPFNLAVGSPNTGSLPSTQNVPAGNGCNGASFDISWNEPNISPYNAVILIF